MKKEITRKLNLSEEERILLNMHSFLNIINILAGELYIMRNLLGGKNSFSRSLQIVDNIRNCLGEDSPAMITPHQMQEFHSFIEQEIAQETRDSKIPADRKRMIQRSTDNLRSLFSIIHTRVREMLARNRQTEIWQEHRLDDLRANLTDFLQAVEKNSKFEFRFVFDAADHQNSTYLMKIRIESLNGKTLFMPCVLEDSFRDIIANARKYTNPGGTIMASLYDDPQCIMMEVSDNGTGIAPDEIDRVVEFGYRAENVLKKQTKGGGFGLTKGYFATRQLNGRMWIESQLETGTTITLQIPKKEQ